MDLWLETCSHYLHVDGVTDHAITVAGRALRQSFLLTPKRIIENWPITSVHALDATQVDAMVELTPELVVLGTGIQQMFPATFMAALWDKGIGIEVMNNAAAARTYDLLAGEGRHTVAAFILPGD